MHDGKGPSLMTASLKHTILKLFLSTYDVDVVWGWCGVELWVFLGWVMGVVVALGFVVGGFDAGRSGECLKGIK